MNESRSNTTKEVNERLSALITNASAIRAITGAVEGTIGPKGLDTMLVDRSGDIVITNAGVTILDRMDVTHPAARMLINIARAQHEEIGDGTTTATIMAGTLVSEGLNQILKGVPVTRVIEGIRQGINCAMDELKKRLIKIDYPDDPIIYKAALIAGRGNVDIAEKVSQAAKLLGKEKIMDPSFKMKEIVTGVEGAENEVFDGILIKKRPINDAMPDYIENPVVLCIDDGLEPEQAQEGSLQTEAGFQRYLKITEEFEENIKKIIALGVKLVLIERGLSDRAEELLTDAGVLVASRLTSRQLRHACEHTGAVALKRTGIYKASNELKKYLGRAKYVKWDKKLKNIRISGGAGKPIATFIVGGPTFEVTEEKERIACDAASAVCAAIRAGVLPGGGSIELAVSRTLAGLRSKSKGMSGFGIDCVIEALRKPISQIIQNAGFNSLEKVEEIIAAQENSGKDSLGIDCDTGEVADMLELGVTDPTLVKLHALKAAGEVAEAILRINTIIKMRESIPDEFMRENFESR